MEEGKGEVSEEEEEVVEDVRVTSVAYGDQGILVCCMKMCFPETVKRVG